MMPIDPIVTDSARVLLNDSVLGALVVLFGAAIVGLNWINRKDRRDLETKHEAELKLRVEELKEEREAHQRTREAQIGEIRNFQTLGQSIERQLYSTETAIEGFTTLVRTMMERK